MDNAPTASGAVPPKKQNLDSATKLVKDGWAIYKNDFKTYLGIALLAGLGVYLIGIANIIHPEESSANLPVVWIPFVIIAGLVYIVMILWGSVALIYKASHSSEPVTLSQAFGSAKGKVWPVFWAGVLTALVTFAGFILVIIPGIIVGVWLTFTSYVVVIEGLRGVAALKRSRYYVKGYWWQVWGRLVAIGIIIGLPVGIIGLIVQAILGKALGTLVSDIISLFAYPLGIITTYLLYKNIVQIKSEQTSPNVPISVPQPSPEMPNLIT